MHTENKNKDFAQSLRRMMQAWNAIEQQVARLYSDSSKEEQYRITKSIMEGYFPQKG
jgi:hypothetical protein